MVALAGAVVWVHHPPVVLTPSAADEDKGANAQLAEPQQEAPSDSRMAGVRVTVRDSPRYM